MINQNIFSWELNTPARKRAKKFSITLMDKNCGHKMLIILEKSIENINSQDNSNSEFLQTWDLSSSPQSFYPYLKHFVGYTVF